MNGTNQNMQDTVSSKSAMNLIGCSKTMFFTKHVKNLTRLNKKGVEVMYSLDEVSKYADALKARTANYNVVKID